LNTAAEYKKLLRAWDPATRTLEFDTADETSKLGSETFHILIKTRGNRNFYYPV
jgi:hypothetical protein